MTKKHTIEQLKTKVKAMEDYLGPRVNYTMNYWPRNRVYRWIMEYCILLKEEYYRRLIRRKNKPLSFFRRIFRK
jgi:hypothetical protein